VGAAGRATTVGDASVATDGDGGAARTCSTGAPAVASGRVSAHVVGAATARVRPRRVVTTAGRTAVS
jgi:hypothetical protein